METKSKVIVCYNRQQQSRVAYTLQLRRVYASMQRSVTHNTEHALYESTWHDVTTLRSSGSAVNHVQ